MSGLPPFATVLRTLLLVCFVPSEAGSRPASRKGELAPSRPSAVPKGVVVNRVTDCVMDVADRSTDVARAQTPCGAATEQPYT
jgi:hypothetical protein